MPGGEKLRQRGAVHGGAAARIEQHRTRLHPHQTAAVEQTDRLRGMGQGQGHHIGLGKQHIQRIQRVDLVESLHIPGAAAQAQNPDAPSARARRAKWRPMSPAPPIKTVLP